jgi:hypothetical protein
MDEKTLWLASFKVRVLEGCPVDFDGSEFMYGEAAGFADSENQFNSVLESKLVENRFEPLETYHLSSAHQAKWVSDREDKADILELLEEVQYTGGFAFGIFRSSRSLEVTK